MTTTTTKAVCLIMERAEGEEEVNETVDEIVCPRCGSLNDLGSRFCRSCGYVLGGSDSTAELPVGDEADETAEELAEKPSQEAAEKPDVRPAEDIAGETDDTVSDTGEKTSAWRVATAITMAVLLGLGVLGAATLLWLRQNQAVGSYQQSTQLVWQQVVDGSNDYKAALNKSVIPSDIHLIRDVNDRQVETAEQAVGDARAVEPPTRYAESHRALVAVLQRYRDYLRAASIVLKDPLAAGEGQLIRMDMLAVETKLLDAGLMKSAGFLRRDIAPEVWQMPLLLRSLIDRARADEEARRKLEQQKRAAEEAKSKELREGADRKQAEDAVMSFMTAYQDRDAGKMKKQLGTQAADGFDSGDFLVAGASVESFDITETNPRTGTVYNIYTTENMTDGEGNSYTTDRIFTVIKESDAWLIDSWKALD